MPLRFVAGSAASLSRKHANPKSCAGMGFEDRDLNKAFIGGLSRDTTEEKLRVCNHALAMARFKPACFKDR